MGEQIKEEKYLSLLLPPYLRKWDQLSDDDIGLFPLFQSFQHVAFALGTDFIKFTGPIFGRCIRLVERSLISFAQHQQDPNIKPPEREFMTTSLDMLSSLCQAIGPDIGQFVRNTQLVPLLLEVCKMQQPDFNQSAFALFGDLARNCPDVLKDLFVHLFGLFLEATYDEHQSSVGMVNNAFWASGELMIASFPQKPLQDFPEAIKPLMNKVLIRCFEVLEDEDSYDVHEAVSVAICRICWVCPVVGRSFFKATNIVSLLVSLRNVKGPPEKTDALRGLCLAILVDPTVATSSFSLLAQVLAQVHAPKEEGGPLQPAPPDLMQNMGTILHQYKNYFGPDKWPSIFRALPPQFAQALAQIYSL